jgi:hypothetical protein
MNLKTNKKDTVLPVEVRWDPRYSFTMEDDDMGRWARVAYAGTFDNMGFTDSKVSRWEIAWIKKNIINEKVKFIITYYYPSNDKYLFDNLEDAQKEVEESFRWFINMCK